MHRIHLYQRMGTEVEYLWYLMAAANQLVRVRTIQMQGIYLMVFKFMFIVYLSERIYILKVTSIGNKNIIPKVSRY
jgi:hypothetical protein